MHVCGLWGLKTSPLPPPAPLLAHPLLSLTGISRRTPRGCGLEAATRCGGPTACGARGLRSRCCWCRCPGSWPGEDALSRPSPSQSPRWPSGAGWKRRERAALRVTWLKTCRQFEVETVTDWIQSNLDVVCLGGGGRLLLQAKQPKSLLLVLFNFVKHHAVFFDRTDGVYMCLLTWIPDQHGHLTMLHHVQ